MVRGHFEELPTASAVGVDQKNAIEAVSTVSVWSFRLKSWGIP